MLRRTFSLRPANNTSAAVSHAASEAAEATSSSSSSSSASSSNTSRKASSSRLFASFLSFRLVSASAAAVALPAAYYYASVYRPRMLLLQRLNAQSRPVRSTAVFTTGSEPIRSVAALATDEYKVFFYLRALFRLGQFAIRSLYVVFLTLRYVIRTKLLGRHGSEGAAHQHAATAKQSNDVAAGSFKNPNSSNSSAHVVSRRGSGSKIDEKTKEQINRAVQNLAAAKKEEQKGASCDDEETHGNNSSKNSKNTDSSTTATVFVPDPELQKIGAALAAVMNNMGGAYVKLGQWCATRSDVFPQEICEALENLYDKAHPHPWSATEQALREAKLLDAFHSIEKQPVSSGTIAQVYKARLKRDTVLSDEDRVHVLSAAMREENARRTAKEDQKAAEAAGQKWTPSESTFDEDGCVDVAVKVMHPRIRGIILEDMQALRWATQLASLLVPGASYLGLTQAVEEFTALLYSQLDMVREAENLNEFRFNFRTSESTVFPRPFLSLTTPDVLVETFEYGVALNSRFVSALEDEGDPNRYLSAEEIAANAKLPPMMTAQAGLRKADFQDLGTLAVEMFLKMVFEHNLVHADLHPGNILIRIVNPDGTYSLARHGPRSHSQIVVLDPGLVTTMSDRERENFIALFTCVATGDGELGAKLMLERSPEQHCRDVPGYLRDMKQVFDRVTPRGLKIEDIDMGGIMREILETMRQHRVRIDMNFASLAATVALGEGLGRRLVNDFNLFESALPFLLHALQSHELHYMISKLNEVYLTAS